MDDKPPVKDKTRLIAKPHAVIEGATVIEIWYKEDFIGTIVGADGPGVRVISKHQMITLRSPEIVTVQINHTPGT